MLQRSITLLLPLALFACEGESNQIGSTQDGGGPLQAPILNEVLEITPPSEGVEGLAYCSSGILGEFATHNSCGLGWLGPFGDIDGTGSPDDPLLASVDTGSVNSLPALGLPQTTYRVELPPGTETTASFLRFTPIQSKAYSFVTDADLPLRILTADGTEIPTGLEQSILEDCDELARVIMESFGELTTGSSMRQLRVVALERGVIYRVAIGPTSVTSFNLLVDEPNEFRQSYFPDADQDGFGDRMGSISSECTAPEHYIDDNTDCDDQRSDVYPGADEPGDGLDHDCDGLADQ